MTPPTLWHLLAALSPTLRMTSKAHWRLSRRVLERSFPLRSRICWRPRTLTSPSWKASRSHALLQCTPIPARHQPIPGSSQKPRPGLKRLEGTLSCKYLSFQFIIYYYCAIQPFCLLLRVPHGHSHFRQMRTRSCSENPALASLCKFTLPVRPHCTCFQNGGCFAWAIHPPGGILRLKILRTVF